MKITNFIDFKKIGGFKTMSAEIVAALDSISKKYGVTIGTSGVRYSDGFADIKLHVALIIDGEIETKDAMEFRQLAHLFDLSPTDLHKSFDFRGQSYKIVGLKSGRRQPIIAKRADGKSFCFDSKLVKASI